MSGVFMGGEMTATAASGPAPETPAVEAPNPASEGADGGETVETPAPEAPEPTFREKMQAKAKEIAESREKESKERSAKTSAEKPQKAAEQPENQVKTAPKESAKAPSGKEAVETPAAFTPNFKLKIMDKDHEVPEVLRAAMKDEASEKQIRELCEKAFGLDYVKPKLEEARKQTQEVTGKLNTVQAQVQHAVTLYQRGDFDGWLKFLQVPQERVLQWVADKIHYNQLPEDQRVILDQRKQAEERAYAAEQQASQLQSTHEQLLNQQVLGALDSVLARPDVKAVADAYDARVGQPGAFKTEVCTRGDSAWRAGKGIVPPEQLVQEMLKIFGPLASTPAPAATTAAQPAPAADPSPKKAPPVIPNISGRGGSAIASPIRSLDELRKRAKEVNQPSAS